MHSDQGFTLVEMLVAISLVSILLSLALPAFQQTLSNNRRTAEVNSFVTAMAFARSEALKRGNRVTLCRTSTPDAANPCSQGNGWEDGWIIFNNEGNAAQPASTAQILRVYEALGANNVTLRGDTNVVNRINYAGNGRMAGTLGNIVWCDSRGYGADSRVITFNLQGRVTTTSTVASVTSCTNP